MSSDRALFEKNLNALTPWFHSELRAAVEQSAAFDLEIVRDERTQEFENFKLEGQIFTRNPQN